MPKGVYPRTSEMRKNISLAQAGKTVSDEAKKNISASLTGIKRSPETIAKIVATRRAEETYVTSEAAREKIRRARLGSKASPETRAKMSAARKGVKLSPAHRESICRAAKRGPESHFWKGGRTTRFGYTLLLRPDHPLSNKEGYVYEHRLVMEERLGRYLTAGEKVHHRNGVKSDNRPENLELIVTKGVHYGAVICPHCQKHFLIQ